MTVILLLLLASLGLAVGSFLNVVIYRVPADLSLVSPRSACPACAHPVRPYDNVPVLSWLVLRGRCRDCGSPIALRYPLVELTTAALFVLVGWQFGPSTYTLALLVLVAGGVALFAIDVDHQRLPFSITGSVAAAVLVLLLLDSATGGGVALSTALLSAGVWLAVYGGTWLATAGRGMGLGDVALAPVLGMALGGLGWGPSAVALLGGFAIGAVSGVVLILVGLLARGVRVAHGPFMLAGCALGLFAGEPLWELYLSSVGMG